MLRNREFRGDYRAHTGLREHGIPATTEAAKKLLAEIDAAEEQARTQVAATQAEAARMAEIEKQQQTEQRYAEAMKPVEELVAAWDFRGALTALAKVQFEEEETGRSPDCLA